MSYYDDAVKRLYHYRNLCRSVKSMQRDLDRLVTGSMPHGLKAVDPEAVRVTGGAVDSVIETMYQISRYRSMIEATMREIVEIERALDDISEGENAVFKPLLQAWYVERLPVDSVCDRVNFSHAYVYRLRDKAIKHFAVRLFGIDALDEL